MLYRPTPVRCGSYPWAATLYGDKGTLKASVWSYDFIPHGAGVPVHRVVTCELEQFPQDKTKKTWRNIARRRFART